MEIKQQPVCSLQHMPTEGGALRRVSGLVAASASATVIVNSVVLVQSALQLRQRLSAGVLAPFGSGLPATGCRRKDEAHPCPTL